MLLLVPTWAWPTLVPPPPPPVSDRLPPPPSPPNYLSRFNQSTAFYIEFASQPVRGLLVAQRSSNDLAVFGWLDGFPVNANIRLTFVSCDHDGLRVRHKVRLRGLVMR